MALLHYENLGVRNPQFLLNSAFYGLRDFYEYLNRTIKHLEDESSVLRLAWSPAEAPEGYDGTADGVWVELREPDDRPNEPDRTFDTFLDEDVREVFELEPSGPTEVVSDPRLARRRVSLSGDFRIGVLDRDPETCRLLLDREPELPELFLRPNTTTMRRQLDAVRQLQDAPAPAHAPLLRLFERTRDAAWSAVPTGVPPARWQVLIDETRPGTREQRAFVDIALRTPDFAFLEGPPGSGKTTAICELVMQLVGAGMRVLLCASTHVAVDNVLERLGPLALRDESDLVPVRVGDRKKVSEAARPFQLERLVETERQRIVAFLGKQRPRTEAQEDLYNTVSRRGTDREAGTIERMILDAANLVCGTTTGILRHPDIRNAGAAARAGMFDVLILDEASKTTFQEFLVPALLARRWVVVGDPKQLSPFIEEAAVAANLVAAVPDQVTRDACVDVFLSDGGDDGRHHPRAAVVVTDDPTTRGKYELQAAARGIAISGASDRDLATAAIVLGEEREVAKADGDLPLDLGIVRGPVPDTVARRARAYLHSIDVREEDPPAWENEIGWRLARHFELRQARESDSATKLLREVEALMPVGSAGERNGAAERIDRVRRVAFPSVLESLQSGFERPKDQRDGTALTDGLPTGVFQSRHVLLEFQHRMHPDISALPRVRVYGGTALKDPPDMERRRAWSYGGYGRRAVWLHVDGQFRRGRNRNDDEVAAVMHELERFRLWAHGEPKFVDGVAHPWEVAILTFYRGQERAMRERLRKLTRNQAAFRHFDLRSRDRVDVRVELCTVDRFQGHEADLVFLSIANTRPTNFLESVNRMNVALTRARYQRVVVGNRQRLRKREGTLLHELAANEPWENAFGGGR
ncbi:MAG: AAA family ATPase [Polyangiaceae bacterium]|nr:AAA family ATPase [Polyangiaceae bacterium]